MTGCDYLTNFDGVGFRTLMKMHINPSKPSAKKGIRTLLIKKSKNEVLVDEFLKNAERTIIGFKHPLILDRSNHLAYLNGDKIKGEGIDKTDLAFFAGSKFDNVGQFVQGKLNIKTNVVREPVDVDFKRITDFLEFIPDASSGRLNNLCARLVTSQNFDRIDSSAITIDEEIFRERFGEFPSSKRIK